MFSGGGGGGYRRPVGAIEQDGGSPRARARERLTGIHVTPRPSLG